MIVISNNAQTALGLPADAVIRVNLAWVANADEAAQILLANQNRSVFLDYPQGRSKPPTPAVSLADAYTLCAQHQNVRYFAVSNVEEVHNIKEIKSHLPENIEFVPKIETLYGVANLSGIVEDCGVRFVMLDKEDLYLDVRKDNRLFFKCIDNVRSTCLACGVNLLELEGVIFMDGGQNKVRRD